VVTLTASPCGAASSPISRWSAWACGPLAAAQSWSAAGWGVGAGCAVTAGAAVGRGAAVGVAVGRGGAVGRAGAGGLGVRLQHS